MEELVNLVTARTPAGNLQEAVRKTLDSVVDRVNLLSAVKEEIVEEVVEDDPGTADIEKTVEEIEED